MKLDPEDREVLGPGWEERRELRVGERERWERRAGQWSTLELAREVFGEGVHVRMAPFPSRGGIRGLLTLTVPFHSLRDHRRREAVFLSLASRDPVLERLPFLFVFEPGPGAIPVPGGGG